MNELREPKFAGEGSSDYEVYIRTDELLALQPEPETWKHRDELLFTVVHQSSELWLKLAIAEINYANIDTGNTGLGWRHLREVYTSFACHLFKNHWAMLQPSCLVVGLPGTLEEARIRATVTFMGAGHVDIGDNLTNMPEDRWSVLLASLPPNDTPAKPVDLFEPIATGHLHYLASGPIGSGSRLRRLMRRPWASSSASGSRPVSITKSPSARVSPGSSR